MTMTIFPSQDSLRPLFDRWQQQMRAIIAQEVEYVYVYVRESNQVTVEDGKYK